MSKEVRDIRMVFLVFTAFFALFAYKNFPSVAAYLLIFFAVLVLCLLVFLPLTLRPIFVVWLKVAHAIGKFNTEVLMLVVFTFIFSPIGLVMRLTGRDSMKRRFVNKPTYWEEYKIKGLDDKKYYERQF